MVERIHLIDKQIPIYFLHGELSWIDKDPSMITQSKRSNVFIETIQGAGHHVSKNLIFIRNNLFLIFFKVYADVPEEFEIYLKRILINRE